jgi:DNA-binding GntR family transcriptional regulator
LLQRTTLSQQVEQIVSAKVFRLELRPGDRVDVERLKKELGISISPIRDALLRLQQRGVVKTVPNVGYFVVKPTRRDVEEVLGVREILEVAAIERAAEFDKGTLLKFRQQTEELRASVPPVSEVRAIKRAALAATALAAHRPRIAEPRTSAPVALAEEPLTSDMHLFIVESCGNRRLSEAYYRIYDMIGMLMSLYPLDVALLDEHLVVIDALLAENRAKAKHALRSHLTNVLSKELLLATDSFWGDTADPSRDVESLEQERRATASETV